MTAWPLSKKTWSDTGQEAGPHEIPPIDLVQPAEVETATFALG